MLPDVLLSNYPAGNGATLGSALEAFILEHE
jgi:hypothetical protein